MDSPFTIVVYMKDLCSEIRLSFSLLLCLLDQPNCIEQKVNALFSNLGRVLDSKLAY